MINYRQRTTSMINYRQKHQDDKLQTEKHQHDKLQTKKHHDATRGGDHHQKHYTHTPQGLLGRGVAPPIRH